MKEVLKIEDFLHPRPVPSGIDVTCKLQHFAIITYAVDPARFVGLFPSRFRLDIIIINGEEKALISVVPFVDIDFTSAVFPFPKFTMGQTNYRIYVIDTLTGERCVWFLGTTLDSWTIVVPRYVWQLPWHGGKITFDCLVDEDEKAGIYKRYNMVTESAWAPASVEIHQEQDAEFEFPGFPDPETALVYLTHPLAGFYYRRDGKLGTYRVWHKQLQVKPAVLTHAHFGLLSRMQLVTLKEQAQPYSVLVEPVNEFTIYLPPAVIQENQL